MSFFPSDELPDRSASNSPSWTLFNHPYLEHQPYDWKSSNSTDYDTAPPHQTPLKRHDSLGLGLFTLPSATTRTIHDLGIQQPVHTSSQSWPPPSVFSSVQTPIQHPQPLRGPSWTDANVVFEPTQSSTLRPSLLSQPQDMLLTPPTCTISPALSEYSPSSFPSARSTPYARSEGAMPSMKSPVIKIESDATPAIPQIFFTPQSSPPEPPQVVNPEDLIVKPQPVQLEADLQACDNVSLLTSEIGEFKRPIGGSTRRRAYSSEEMLRDRKKRVHTKPSQATCSCEKCGKPFQRAYNLKAHMETHDRSRPHPHGCEYYGCEKRFVRRTDLQRHEQSVSSNPVPWSPYFEAC
jgi:hypothetical protein